MIDLEQHLNHSFSHIENSGHQTRGLFVPSADLPYFLGHFPDFPVLPAVAILDVSAYFIKKFLLENINHSIQKLEYLKLKIPVHPNTKILLQVNQNDPVSFYVKWVEVTDTIGVEKVICELSLSFR